MTANIRTEKWVALVTGASHGIGFEICRQLAQQGMVVYLTARNQGKAEAAVAQLTVTAKNLALKPAALDVVDDASVSALAKRLAQEDGKLDVLVNNAAAYADWTETASTANLNQTRSVLETTLFGPWRITQVFLPLIRHSPHGRIVNVTSGAGSFGEPQFGLTTGSGTVASYGVAKAALNALSVKFATELAGSGILVNAVDPGLTATVPGMEAMGARPVSEGAASVVWAATLPDAGPNGGFFRDGKSLPW